MKTKRIWIWSLIFGIVAALILYVSLFSNLTSEPALTTEEEETVTKEEGQTDGKVSKRNFPNPIIEVSEGQRAISLKVDPTPGVSGYIEPGSHVDVIAYTTTKDENTKKDYKTAMLVLQNKKVLAVGKSSNNEEEALNYESVTLEVNPKEGVMLSLAAKDKDGFNLMLRNQDDSGVENEVIQETREVYKGDGE